MKRVWKGPVLVLMGLLLAAMYAMPQTYTISAKPGAINYIEGNAFLNSNPVSDKGLKSTFLNANDTLSTDIGKAEVLLTPGVFLRLGENTQVRMISPSLENTQVEVNRGEVMLEATGLMKDNNLQIIDHGASIRITKNGLYRFSADDPPTAAVLDGKAEVLLAEEKINLKKGKQTILAQGLTAVKFDTKKQDDLYAWSNVRSEYEAAASYRVAQNASLGTYGALGYGFNAGYGPGWLWDAGFNSWAWLPGSGAFYSPFGYGFYSPGVIGYAPIVTVPVYRGGRHGPWNGWHGRGVAPGTPVSGNGVVAHVPISPSNPPALGVVPGSPWAAHAARMQAARSLAGSGVQTGAGGTWHGGGGWRGGTRNPGAAAHPGFSGGGGWHGGGAHAGGGRSR